MIRLLGVSFDRFTIPLRRPFGFGIATLTELSHLLVRCRFDIDGDEVEGIAGENLAPKWFTKRPGTTLDEDVGELLDAIAAVRAIAERTDAQPSAFDFWLALYRRAKMELPSMPALLRQFAVSLFERCAIDAISRRAGRPIWVMLRDGEFGVRLGDVHPDLAGRSTREFLPDPPPATLAVRHTIGLADDLAELPAIVVETGIRRFKIKLGGQFESDVARLSAILATVRDSCGDDFIYTLDGNENFATVDLLRRFVGGLARDPRLKWIEQPLHRIVALRDEVAALTAEFPHVAFVLDESDDDLSSLPRALSLGYRGTTHKNCKGVFKSVANACLLRHRQPQSPRPLLLSGEDLTMVAPWSQVQDLAVAAAVGVIDVERNGHHYADGLSAFSREVQEAAVMEYPHLYRCDADGIVRLRIENGCVASGVT